MASPVTPLGKYSDEGITITPNQAAYYQRGLSEKSLKIVDLYNSGMNYTQIAKELKCSTKVVYTAVERARLRGVDVRPRQKEDSAQRRKRLTVGHRIGLMNEMLDILEEPVLKWLVSQVPSGVSIAEYLVTVVRDAYEEELENEQPVRFFRAKRD